MVARSIGNLETEPAVRDCLMALFTFELTSSNNRNAPFKKAYENEIARYAHNWNAEAEQQ